MYVLFVPFVVVVFFLPGLVSSCCAFYFDRRLYVLVGVGVDCGSCVGGSLFVFIVAPVCSGLVVVVGVVDVDVFRVLASCLLWLVWWVGSLACAFC